MIKLNENKIFSTAICNLMIIILFGCTKQPEPFPCGNVTPTSAAFTARSLYSSFEWIDPKLMEDSVFYGNSSIQFYVNDKNVDSCKWEIEGYPKVRTDQIFNLLSDDFYGPFNVKLTVKKNSAIQCFANDNGTQTLSRKITRLPAWQHPIYGRYEGTDDEHPNESYTITLYTTTRKDDFNDSQLFNFPKGFNIDSLNSLSKYTARISLVGNRYFSKDFISDIPSGVVTIYNTRGILSKNMDTLTIEYLRTKGEFPGSVDLTDTTKIASHKFIGIRKY